MSDARKGGAYATGSQWLMMQVENVECMEEPANHIKFDFLGKDSIRYENEVEVEAQVWKLVKQFCSGTGKGKGETTIVNSRAFSFSLPMLATRSVGVCV